MNNNETQKCTLVGHIYPECEHGTAKAITVKDIQWQE